MTHHYIVSLAELRGIIPNGTQGINVSVSPPGGETVPGFPQEYDPYFSPFDSVSMFSPFEGYGMGMPGFGPFPAGNGGMFQMVEMMGLLMNLMSLEGTSGVAQGYGSGSGVVHVVVNNNPYALVPTGQSASSGFV